MPADPRKRQKQQERRAAKRKSKQHQLAKVKHAGLPERFMAAAHYPVLHCWASNDLWTQGLGWVSLSRLLPNGTVALAVFLIVRYCQGVKNVLAEINGRSTYENRVTKEWRSKFSTKDITPACARKFVEEAVAYAAGLGLHPHADYQKAALLFGDIDASECTEKLEFGKDGKPLFIAGPYDTPERSRHVLKALERSRGRDSYHFQMPISPETEVLSVTEGQEAAALPFEADDPPSN